MKTLRTLTLVLLAAASPAICEPTVATAFEGYGAITTGGSGGDVYHVTTLANSGAGSLRNGITNRTGARTIVFDVAGDIVLSGTVTIDRPFLTIDGSTAPAPGITIRQNTLTDQFIIAGTHDIILTHLRFWGKYEASGATDINNAATIIIDGDSGPDQVAQRIILDHITGRNSEDGGPDIWGEVRDVTVSWSFFFFNNHPTTISHVDVPFQIRQRISMHHNVYAKNTERNPQFRADVRDFDYVNNIVYDWGFFAGGSGYGVRIRSESGEPKVDLNFVNNALIPKSGSQCWGLVYGTQPGADSTDGGPSGSPAQGTVVSGTRLGNIWVAGNILPSCNADQYSTISAPLPVPASAQVTTWSANQLGTQVLPTVGWKYRTAEEQAILDEIRAALPGSPPAALPSAPVGLSVR
jgi:pectate lyase